MKFQINWLVRKSPEWIVAELKDESGTEFKEVSINKVSKKGEPFPNFDGLQPGREIEGELWTSEKGKHYLFPPRADKPRGGAGGAFKTAQIEKVMDRKEESIGKFQDKKEEGIALSGAQRDAVLMTTTYFGLGSGGEEGLKAKIIEWRNWFLSEEFRTPPPF